jgi:hypothetical protein
MADGKPWWGLLGLSFFGEGPRVFEGDSSLSRFIENPYLLVGAGEVWANVVRATDETPHPIYPRPLYLGFDAELRRGWARYDVTSFYKEGAKLGYREPRDKSLSLTALNAADLGLPYVYVDGSVSDNLGLVPRFVERVRENVHAGRCSDAGDCNIVSKGIDIALERLPARVALRLWRQAPASSADPPDVWFVLELV